MPGGFHVIAQLFPFLFGGKSWIPSESNIWRYPDPSFLISEYIFEIKRCFLPFFQINLNQPFSFRRLHEVGVFQFFVESVFSYPARSAETGSYTFVKFSLQLSGLGITLPGRGFLQCGSGFAAFFRNIRVCRPGHSGNNESSSLC